MIQLVLELSPSLLERLQAQSSLLGLSLEEMALRALDKGLPSPRPAQSSLFEAPPPSKAPSPAGQETASSRSTKPFTTGFDGTWLLWADGACSGNPGPGGFGIVVAGPEGEEEFSRGYKNTTNNRMELRGAIEALERVPAGASAVLHTDSRYVVDAIQKKWVDGWMKRGWRKADGGEVKNVDLWELLTSAMRGKKVWFKWVEGHAGNAGNERCDKLAVAATKGPKLEIDREG